MHSERILESTLLTALVAVPLVIAPGWVFHFDVMPKAVVVLVAAAVALPFYRAAAAGLRSSWSRWPGRLFLIGIGLLAVSSVASTVASERVALSFGGTNWRAMGLFVRLALVALAALLLGWMGSGAARRDRLLRAAVWTSVPISLYAILQYFGVDPLQPALYYAGEEVWAVVRPPATMGHAGYLGVYLAAIAFWGAGLEGRVTRGAAALAVAAILLGGSRGALVGLAMGAAVWMWRRRSAVSVRAVGLAAAVAVVLSMFVLSPAGERLRTRVLWSVEDFHGGSRPWLWRDTLQMGLAQPFAGHGVETFTSSYPKYKSVELARRYPDQYQESAHNPLLEAWAEQGALGLIAWLAIFGGGLAGALRRGSEETAGLAGAYAASSIAAQFLSWTIASQLFVLAAAAAVVAGGPAEKRRPPTFAIKAAKRAADKRVTDKRVTAAVASLSAAFLWFAWAAGSAEVGAERARAAFNDGRIADAVEIYESARPAAPPGRSLDFWFSRRLLAALDAATIADPALWETAARSADRAADDAEQRANALYNLAEVQARNERIDRVTRSLRRAIEESPTWYAPRVRLAQVLALAGREEEARAEAGRAIDLAGVKRDAVREELASVLGAVKKPTLPAGGVVGDLKPVGGL